MASNMITIVSGGVRFAWRHQAITWNNADLFSIGLSGTNVCENQNKWNIQEPRWGERVEQRLQELEASQDYPQGPYAHR